MPRTYCDGEGVVADKKKGIEMNEREMEAGTGVGMGLGERKVEFGKCGARTESIPASP
jgi:hypothetical protein